MKYLLGLGFIIGISLMPFHAKAQDNDPDHLGAPNIIKSGHSGNVHKPDKNEKKAAAIKAKQKKEADKAYKEGQKFHQSIQQSNTKAMMKESKRKAQKVRDNDPRPWWKKIF